MHWLGSLMNNASLVGGCHKHRFLMRVLRLVRRVAISRVGERRPQGSNSGTGNNSLPMDLLRLNYDIIMFLRHCQLTVL